MEITNAWIISKTIFDQLVNKKTTTNVGVNEWHQLLLMKMTSATVGVNDISYCWCTWMTSATVGINDISYCSYKRHQLPDSLTAHQTDLPVFCSCSCGTQRSGFAGWRWRWGRTGYTHEHGRGRRPQRGALSRTVQRHGQSDNHVPSLRIGDLHHW